MIIKYRKLAYFLFSFSNEKLTQIETDSKKKIEAICEERMKDYLLLINYEGFKAKST
jgi:hypothetical protein